jgi:hypothetical protein
MGLYQLEQMCDCVESFTLALMTRVLGWSPRAVDELVAQVKAEFRNKRNHLYAVFHFVRGRKPLAG